MKRTISTWDDFATAWSDVHNFLMAGELTGPFQYEFPPIEEIVDALRREPMTRITAGTKGDTLHLESTRETFVNMPIEQAVNTQFSVANFGLNEFSGRGQILDGFKEQVMDPWEKWLSDRGFTWNKLYPIFFLSGPGCQTNYHMDYSHVVAWQTHGTKFFTGLKDPERWAPFETRLHARGVVKPEGIADDDAVTYEMKPGDVLWNAFLTPHWVEAGDTAACSINIAIDGLRLNGQLARHEEEIMNWRLEHPGVQVGFY